MNRRDFSEVTYDPLATTLNELYGMYRFKMTSPKIHSASGSNIAYYVRIYMKYHDEGVTFDFIDYFLMKLESDGSDPDPVHCEFVFKSFNDIEGIEVYSDPPVGLEGVQTVTIEKLRASNVYDSSPMVVTTVTGVDPGQVISIQGVINVEAIPGEDLRVDIKPEDDIKDGKDIQGARNMRIVLRHYYGFDFVSTVTKYQEIVRLMREQDLCQRCVTNKAFIGAILPMIGKAAEFGIKYGPALLQASKQVLPMIQHAMPQGRIVGRNKAAM